MTSTTTYLGMDLGTFKTSVMASNGKRQAMPTIVGWPKDVVAHTLLGKSVIFGEEVFRHRLSVDAVRPFEMGALKFLSAAEAEMTETQVDEHRKSAQTFVNHLVDSVASSDQPIYAVIGAPSHASQENKSVILDAVADACQSAMIIPEPFAVAYGMNCLNETVVIDIGAGTTDICLMSGSLPTEGQQTTLPLGGDVIDEHFRRSLLAEYPQSDVTWNMARLIKERYGFVNSSEDRAVMTLAIDGAERSVDVTSLLKDSCSVIVEPIIKALVELLTTFDAEFRDALRGNILLAGGGSQLRGLDRLLEAELAKLGGGHVRRVPDSLYAGAAGALRLALQIPQDKWRSMAA